MKTLKISRFPDLDSVCEESMNTLCTNLSYCGTDAKVIMITSRYPKEGKSYVSMNLMRTMARLGKRVILMDADLRASDINARYGLRYADSERKGLSDFLAGRCALEEVVYATDIRDAFLLPSGYVPPNPLRLLENRRMASAIEFLKAEFDVVLIDTPPVGLIVDAAALGKHCDSALMVVSYRRGKRSDIGEAVRRIEKSGCKVLGAVMNNVNFKKLANKQYYYKSETYSPYRSKKYAYHYQRDKNNAPDD